MSWRSTRGQPARARFCSMRRPGRGARRRSSWPSIIRNPGGLSTTPRRFGKAWSRPVARPPRPRNGAIAAIGIANQRETAILWERATGRPLHNAIVWQDRRTADLCLRWRAKGLAETIAQRTGLVIDPYFSASKIRWLLDTVPGLRRRAEAGEIAFGTIDSFLLWRLTAWQTPRDRCDQCRAHDVVRHQPSRLG